MYGNFNGTIKGNGHTIKNVTIEQTNNSKVNAGLFGYLAETSSLSDLTFENVTFAGEEPCLKGLDGSISKIEQVKKD